MTVHFIGTSPAMFGEAAPDLILVDRSPEYPGHLLSDSAAANVWVAQLQCINRLYEFP